MEEYNMSPETFDRIASGMDFCLRRMSEIAAELEFVMKRIEAHEESINAGKTDLFVRWAYTGAYTRHQELITEYDLLCKMYDGLNAERKAYHMIIDLKNRPDEAQ